MSESLPTDLVTELRQFAQAYPADVFGPVTDAEVKEHASLITRNSAAMGRHFAPWFTLAANEIERLRAREKLLLERHTGCGCDSSCPVCDELGFT